MTDPTIPRDQTHHWPWFAAAGGLMLVLGIYAITHIMTATAATVLIIGVTMVIGGVVQIFVAARARGLQGAMLWAVSGVLYVFAGICVITDPLLASDIFTIFLAVTLVGSGASRIMFGRRVWPTAGWDWIVASGVISLIVGTLIAIGWPENVWVLGLILAVDMFGQGAALLVLSLTLRALR